MVFWCVIATTVSCSRGGVHEAEERVEKGRALAEESRFHDALTEFSAALQSLDEQNLPAPELRMKAYNGLGSISYIFGDTLSAVAYYAKAWRWGRNIGDNRAKTALASNLAMSYNSVGKTDSARIYNDTLKILSRNVSGFPRYQYYFNLGRIEFSAARWEPAVAALDSALTVMCSEYPSGRENSEIYILLAKSYLQLGDSAKAFENTELGDVNAEFEDNDNNKLRAFHDLESLYRKLNKSVKADAYAERIYNLKESIISHNRLLETRKSTGQHEEGNDILAITITLGVVLLMVLAACWAVRLHKGRNKSSDSHVSPETEKHDIMEKLDEIMKTTKAFKEADFDISQLSHLAGINTKYISKAINATGRNFRTFTAEYRIEYAIRLLTDADTMGKYTIESVGREVGFKSHTNFIAAFRKIKGTTPSAYLRSLK